MTLSSSTREILFQLLREGRRIPFRLTGTSMLPLIRPGESILLEKAEPGRLNLGTLIVFEFMGEIVAHRILRKRCLAGRCWIQTACQEARIPDSWILETDVIGCAVQLSGASMRSAPAGFSAILWAWKTRAQCHLHGLRKRLGRFVSI